MHTIDENQMHFSTINFHICGFHGFSLKFCKFLILRDSLTPTPHPSSSLKSEGQMDSQEIGAQTKETKATKKKCSNSYGGLSIISLKQVIYSIWKTCPKYLFAPIQVVKSSSIHSSLTFPKRSTRASLFSPHSSMITGLRFDQFSNIPWTVSPSATFLIEKKYI